MLRKIVSIRNVGRFLNHSCSGDVELKRYNLIFAENGRGKTTLCAIFRSLQSGDPAHILGRTTLGVGEKPDITLLLDGGTGIFRNGAWSATVPHLVIFDSTFVSENVYSGDVVELGHRRNLYRVIVGREGVELAHQIEELDATIRDKNTEIRDKRTAVQALIPQDITVEDFLRLPEDAAIDTTIMEKQRELDAIKQADQIKSRPSLGELSLPTLPDALARLLNKTIEGVAEDAERRVSEQVKSHGMHSRGESWLSEGLSYVQENACPFCGQAVDRVDLVAAYKTYFSDSYRSLRTEIANLRQLLETTFSDREIGRLERIMDQNTAAADFWARFCTISTPKLGVDSLGDAIRSLRQTALALLDRKAASPLDRLEIDTPFKTSNDDYAAVQHAVTAYNQAVLQVNTTIQEKKSATGSTDVRGVESAITRLRATKKRHEPEVIATCGKYEEAQAEKKTLEDRKAATRQTLDKYTEDVIGRYEQSINRLLDDVQAGFQITETKHGYPGGVASSSYQVLINGTPVELGDSNTPTDKPSFRNTLSSGDRSILALAFFLAQLEHDREKGSKIVVFDDPFNSQDSFRKNWTVQQIKKCGESSSQVIVLSHDQSFLKCVWDRLATQSADRKCLELTRVGLRDTKVSPWDIDEATQPRSHADRKALAEYYRTGQGTPRDTVNKIRPVLETHCRTLYNEFANDTLGTIIGKVRTFGPNNQLFPLLDDLDGLNEYTRRYMHGEGPSAETEPIDGNELQSFVKKTLNITGGC